ncbi:MAG: hypothetical protein KKE44_12075 [Proteobacteria bacterium]|nr:hypothetical protein [Pseudomonadota bacterium]MBU1583463.1 hypothetical protein [Pseudomonadota bacterium]MBU2451945.1 hypothetical protein [Pseudomonadota bacterium]MBU2628472.1 hypothetical protein [Pseudomonadota bacterium]
MPSTSYYCSVSQGFNFYPDAQEIVGHIAKLKVAGKELKADLEVTTPEDITGDNVKVVGIMSGISWDGGMADPIEFQCQVSVKNKQELMVLQHSDLSDTSVEFQFKVFEYDPVKKKYFPAFHTDDTDLKGLVAKSGSDLHLNIDMDESGEVANPINFALSLGVMPEDEKQDIHMAASVDGKFVKAWGIKVG